MVIAKDGVLSTSEIKPGQLEHLIESVAEQSSESKTYKICVDGKKINSRLSGPEGDIDLFGFEGKPTLAEKRETPNRRTLHSTALRLRAFDISGKRVSLNLRELDRNYQEN